ncbi:hypothetical protein FN846DRAFT_934150 [Sphaerosporella brunnea]|uniref:Uncharacterized protein n=1 Tax=Sphaerosporella brunnea TaxID=1250544 RepID=A0A5J5F6H1_9PEZI|nr:hypothetical protein FN846DRAFT_934150 [Sphaerosporella brunnea]
MSDSEQTSLPNRRLSLRNSRLSVSSLSFTGGGAASAHHRKRSSSGGISPFRKKIADSEAADEDERDWEDEVSPDSEKTGRRARERAASPPTSSPYLYAPTTYHRRGRSTDGNQKYIDYLERQVEDLTNQLQGYTSATSNTSHAAKMRQLRAENRTLAHELAEWEADFERRVRDEVQNNLVIDESLRAAVAELEGRLEDREHSLRMANMEVKTLRRKCEQLGSIQEENKNLILRIETLTDLLADSSRTIQRRTVSAQNTSRPPTATNPKRVSSLPGSAQTTEGGETVEQGRTRKDSRGSSYKGVEDYGITDPIDLLDAPPSPALSQASYSSGQLRRSFANGPPLSPIPVPTSPNNIRTRRLRRLPEGSPVSKTLIFPSAEAESISRPMSSHSDSGIGESQRPSFENIGRSLTYPNPNRNSLFAELARAVSDSEDSETEETTQAGDNNTEKEDYMTLASSVPNSPHTKALDLPLPIPQIEEPEPEEPSSPESDAFDFVADAITNPTPLIVKVLSTACDGIASPTRTLGAAKRKAIDMVGNVVGRGVDRVSQRRTQVLAASKTQRSRRTTMIYSEPPPPSFRSQKLRTIAPSATAICKECGAPRRVVSNGSVKRSVGGLRKRSGSVVQPVIEDGIDVIWLWVRFIIAVVVALGVAVKDGPPNAVVMVDDGEGIDHVREEERELALKRLEGKVR